MDMSEAYVNLAFNWNNPETCDTRIIFVDPEDNSNGGKKRSSDDVEKVISLTGGLAISEASRDCLYIDSQLLIRDSPFFKTLLFNSPDEKDERIKTITVELEENERKYFKDMTRFMYTEEFETPKSDLFRIIAVADRFDFHGISKHCRNIFFSEDISLKEACQILDEVGDAKQEGFEELVKHCRNIIKDNHKDLESVAVQQSFLELGWRGALCVLTGPVASVTSENIVFQLVKQWIRHDISSRKESAHLLLFTVRYPLMSPDFLHCVVRGNDVFDDALPPHSNRLKYMAMGGLYYALSDKKTQQEIMKERTDYKKISMTPRPGMFNSSKKYVDFEWKTKVPDTGNSDRSPLLFAHGYYLYGNIMSEKNPEGESISITFHIDGRATGIKNASEHRTTLNYKLYLKHLTTGAFEGVGVVDHTWTKDAGWGKTIKGPGADFVSSSGSLTILFQVALGESEYPAEYKPPAITKN